MTSKDLTEATRAAYISAEIIQNPERGRRKLKGPLGGRIGEQKGRCLRREATPLRLSGSSEARRRLEVEASDELYAARREGLGRVAEVLARERVLGYGEVDVVEKVEEVRANREPVTTLVAERDALDQREVDVVVARAVELVAREDAL